MSLEVFSVEPGVNRDDTPSASKGRIIDANLIRFDKGRPETIGGWERFMTQTLGGVCRSILAWRDSDSARFAVFGQHDRLTAYSGGAVADITPVAFTAGEIDGLAGAGFGTGGFGGGGFGSPSEVTTSLFPMSWSLAQWGEDLLVAPRRQGLFFWQRDMAAKPVAVAAAPSDIGFMFVTPERFVVCLATNEEIGGAWNPMLVRWGDMGFYDQWTTTATGEHREIVLQGGNILVGGIAGVQEHLIWSDTSLFAMRQTFDDAVWGFPKIGDSCGLIGPQAMAQLHGNTYWMGLDNFFIYAGGAPQVLKCEVRDDVFDNIAPAQHEKVQCGVNPDKNEVWWFYPDVRDGKDNSRYVALNVLDGTWSTGRMARSAWLGNKTYERPIATTKDGAVYFHEIGATADGEPLGASLETGLFDLQSGEFVAYIEGCMPDLKGQLSGVDLYVYTRMNAQGEETEHGPYRILRSGERMWFEVAGRFVRFKLVGVGVPEAWRLGDMRFYVKQTGMRE